MNKKDIIVLIPTYNNSGTIENVVRDVLDSEYDLLIVDDGSDIPVEENEYIRGKKIFVIRHDQNQGKGAAILTGANEIRKRGYQYFVTMDGDGQHLSSQIFNLIENIREENILVIGKRNMLIENVPKSALFGLWFSNIWASLTTNQKITDSLSGFRLYPISILDLPIHSRKFDFEMEVLIRHSWKKRKIQETQVECFYPPQIERVSHFRKFWDTMSIVWVHVKLLPLRIFNR